MPDESSQARLRALPSVRALLEQAPVAALEATHGHTAVLEAARGVVAEARATILAGGSATVGPAEVLARLEASLGPRLRPVVNATGVVLHTNLGRAPLAESALRRALEASRGYTNLELVLETGVRGGRDDGVRGHLSALVGAEDALAVNNCAAAALLGLAALASGREVVVSRGELVEIGGGFRVPEVLEQGGCRLVEVGTTNRTRLADYERALGPATGAVLKVHRSNFALVGFTEEASLTELAAALRGRGLPLLYDQGTGDLALVRGALEAGADLVMFSGDKLLGGPQAGLVAGRREHVERLRRHPLARALRIDKLRLAALEETLSLWRRGRTDELPAARMLAEPVDVVRARAQRLAQLLDGLAVRVEASEAAAGGGTRPGETIGSCAVAWTVPGAAGAAARLRSGPLPVVARVADGAVVFDLRTVRDDELAALADAVRRAAADGPVASHPAWDGREGD